MGLLDDAKDAAKATGEKISRTVEDTKERISDHVDEAKAENDVKRAEAERDATKAKNDYKESLRD
jgi:gas vesicle protein